MTITISPEAEARLNEKARRDGKDVNMVADALDSCRVDWQRGTEKRPSRASGVATRPPREGRERPLTEFFAEQRAKHGFPASWPHTSTSKAAPMSPDAGDEARKTPRRLRGSEDHKAACKSQASVRRAPNRHRLRR
jgi:hypothetical protein